jgi:hypothetical protein
LIQRRNNRRERRRNLPALDHVGDMPEIVCVAWGNAPRGWRKGAILKKLIWVSLFLLGAAAAPACANTINIGGTFSGTATLTGGPTIFTESFTGTGLDVTFGAFTGTEQATVDASGYPGNLILSNGTFNWAFAQGNLIGTFSGSGPAASVAITFLITSGFLPGDTGQGTGTESFLLVTSSNTANVGGSYIGTIDTIGTLVDVGGGIFGLAAPTPIPAALPLFATGLGAVGLLGWRRKRKAAAVAA